MHNDPTFFFSGLDLIASLSRHDPGPYRWYESLAVLGDQEASEEQYRTLTDIVPELRHDILWIYQARWLMRAERLRRLERLASTRWWAAAAWFPSSEAARRTRYSIAGDRRCAAGLSPHAGACLRCLLARTPAVVVRTAMAGLGGRAAQDRSLQPRRAPAAHEPLPLPPHLALA